MHARLLHMRLVRVRTATAADGPCRARSCPTAQSELLSSIVTWTASPPVTHECASATADGRPPPRAQLSNCGLSDVTVRALEARGITALFPIQKHVFEPARDGKDLIGRARTGSGKTLAFSLPVIEELLKARARLALCAVLWPALASPQAAHKAFVACVCCYVAACAPSLLGCVEPTGARQAHAAALYRERRRRWGSWWRAGQRRLAALGSCTQVSNVVSEGSEQHRRR